MAGNQASLVFDIRAVTPSIRNKLVFGVIDQMLDDDARDSIVLICDHDPAALGYQIDLRKRSRGCYEFFYDRRLDGSWVALLKRKTNGSAERSYE